MTPHQIGCILSWVDNRLSTNGGTIIDDAQCNWITLHAVTWNLSARFRSTWLGERGEVGAFWDFGDLGCAWGEGIARLLSSAGNSPRSGVNERPSASSLMLFSRGMSQMV